MTTNYAPSNDYYAAPASATAPKSTTWILGGVVAFMGLAVLGLGGGWAFSAQGQSVPAPAAQPVEIAAAAPAQGLPAAALPTPAPAVDQGATYIGTAGAPQVGRPASAPNAVSVPGPAVIPDATGGPGVIIVDVEDPTSTTTPPQPEPPASEPPAPEPPASEPPIIRDHRADCVPRTGVICVGTQQPAPQPAPAHPVPPQQHPPLPPYNPAPAPPSTCTIFNNCPAPTGPVVRDHRN